jgi:hypothetical protein
MEYFSSKYPEYSPKLPSEILNVLEDISFERLLPSQGLDINKLSFAIKKFNFGSIIYSKSYYDNGSIFRFHNLLSCYVNSGIPVLLAIQNSNIAHALSCIGVEKLNHTQIEELNPTNFISQTQKEENLIKGINFFDLDDCKRKFIFSDDNYPPYQLALLEEPTKYYSDITWRNTKITHFVVPLYAKIYLEAYNVKTYLYSYLISGLFPLKNLTNYYLKIFIASSRSCKDYMVKNEEFEYNIKEIILELAMPKFIWVCEISNKELIKKEQANGLIIIDATEANKNDLIPMYSGHENFHVLYDKEFSLIKKIELPLQPFKIYNKNLQEYN